jgi:hypothetical protein
MTASCFVEAAQALKGVFDRVDGFLKDDLLGGMLELLAGQPAPMRQRPMTASAVDAAVAQEEGKQLLAFAAKVVPRRLARPHKIAHRFMRRIRRPDSGQLAGPVQSRQRDGVAPVRLDPFPGALGNQGRRDHHAIVAERLDLTIEPVSRRPGFKAHVQRAVALRQSLDRSLDRSRAVLDLAQEPDLPGPASLRDRHRVLLLGDVKSDKNFAMLSHGPPSVHEARLGSPEQPSFLTARKGGPPARAREHDV